MLLNCVYVFPIYVIGDTCVCVYIYIYIGQRYSIPWVWNSYSIPGLAHPQGRNPIERPPPRGPSGSGSTGTLPGSP
jgi:hypothetical protein